MTSSTQKLFYNLLNMVWIHLFALVLNLVGPCLFFSLRNYAFKLILFSKKQVVNILEHGALSTSNTAHLSIKRVGEHRLASSLIFSLKHVINKKNWLACLRYMEVTAAVQSNLQRHSYQPVLYSEHTGSCHRVKGDTALTATVQCIVGNYTGDAF